jgi:hypothetical protein
VVRINISLTTKIQFLLVPEAGTNLFGRDLITRLGIGLHVNKGIALGVLTQKHGGQCQSVAFLSKFLDPVTQGWPAHIQAVAATALLTEERENHLWGRPNY